MLPFPLPDWMMICLGTGTFVIVLGAILYAGYCEKKYQTPKSLCDFINMLAALGSSCLILLPSPISFSIPIGVAILVFLLMRNWLAIKRPLPAIVMTLLMFGGFVNWFWVIGFKVMRG